MRRIIFLAGLLCGLFALTLAQDEVLRSVTDLERAGAFTEASKLLTDRLAVERNPALRRTWQFELDRLRRIRLDYSASRDKLWTQVQRAVRDITKEEFEQWIADGRFDRRTIDGQEWFVYTSRSNLFWRYPDAAARRLNPPNDTAFDRSVWQNALAITNAAADAGRPYVLPKRFSVTMNVTVDPKGIPDGSTVRAWLPIPRSFPFQTNFRLVRSSSPATLDNETSPIRSAYMERVLENDSTLDFEVEYEYTHFGIRFPLDPARVEPTDASDPAVREFTREGPHVVFTDTMRSIAASIAGEITNPLKKARAYYDWIAENIQYSYAIEYSTIRNISEYCLINRYGDCGQEALLFMTLCRLSGIPARWQSGWFTFPGGKTNHDWTEIYVRPWGWIPVDPYMGIFARQYLTTLGPQEQQAVQDFYFGGLDQYRIAANSDHSQALRPPKRGLRSDDVDFQRGELEYDGTNIYFDAMSYSVSVTELPPPH
ncbi:MAG: transglutaminase-like domain-containing protein [Bacteroidota bacterium]